MEWLKCLLNFLNNTFIGTFFAGILLAFFGLFLYKKQKKLDYDFNKKKRIDEAGTNLFSSIETANKFYAGQLNIYNEELGLGIIKNLKKETLEKFNTSSMEESNIYVKDINKKLNELVSYLKLEGPKFDKNIENLTTEVTTFNIFILSVAFLSSSSKEDIKEYKTNLDESYKKIKNEIFSLIS